MDDYGDMTLLEGIEKFFNPIKQKCFSKEEYATELLKARGFLLEDKGLVLSDNSHKWDAEYLNRLLTSENIGEVQGDKIIIFQNANVEKIFYSGIQYGSESFLAYAVPFLRYDYAPKVFVGLLEKFIARYVKAISACGIQTHGSCDGNHHRPPYRGICIEISSGMGEIWHKILCERLLYKRFKFRWVEGNGRIIIKIHKMNKWFMYSEINRAAEFLYNHRIEIRKIKHDACEEINNIQVIDRTTDIMEFFSESANKLFDKILIE